MYDLVADAAEQRDISHVEPEDVESLVAAAITELRAEAATPEAVAPREGALASFRKLVG
jgi:hypothetical protein